MHLGLLNGLPDLVVILFGDLDLQARHVLVEVFHLGRARDGDDVVALRH